MVPSHPPLRAPSSRGWTLPQFRPHSRALTLADGTQQRSPAARVLLATMPLRNRLQRTPSALCFAFSPKFYNIGILCLCYAYAVPMLCLCCAMPCYTTSCCAVSCCAVTCYAVLCHFMLCYGAYPIIPWHQILCYVMLCCAALCYDMLPCHMLHCIGADVLAQQIAYCEPCFCKCCLIDAASSLTTAAFMQCHT